MTNASTLAKNSLYPCGSPPPSGRKSKGPFRPALNPATLVPVKTEAIMVGMIGAFSALVNSGYRCLKATLVADFVDHYAFPTRVCSAAAVCYPLIDSVKALRPRVAHQHPQQSFSMSLREKVGTRGCDQGSADALAPLVRLHVKRAQFSVIRQIRVARGHRCGKSKDSLCSGRHDRSRL